MTEAYEQCQTNQTLECIRDNVPSDCTSCICTLACKLSDDSAICNLCTENSQKPLAPFWNDTGLDKEINQSRCPPGWAASYLGIFSNRKCFKVFEETKLSWIEAQKECFDQGYQLAISDTEQKIDGVADAMSNSNQKIKSCWIGGSSTSSTPLLFDWMPAPQTGNQSFAVIIDHWRTRNVCPIGLVTESCMYVDRNGDWCNDRCTNLKCYVCETNPEILD